MTAARATGSGSGRTVALLVAIVVVIAGVVALSGPGTGAPYDLDDAGAQGYKGLRLVLERLGGTVERIDAGRLDADLARRDPVVFVPVADNASRAQARSWDAYARAGGTLVLGSPRPGVGPRRTPASDFEGVDVVNEPPSFCDLDALDGVGSIDPAEAQPITRPIGATSCYGGDDAALVVEQRVGAGRVVTLASPDLFTNDAMRPHDQEVDDPHEPMRDNVVVAQRLLDPGGSGRVAVVTSGLDTALASGQTVALSHFLRPGVKVGIWELLAAFAFFAWWRGRRHGRVVAEPQPVAIAGSELVSAVGNLMSRRQDPGRAADVVRLDTLRALSERLGVPRGTDPALLASMISTRTGRDEHAVLGALAATPVQTDADLLTVTHQLESIRQEMLHG